MLPFFFRCLTWLLKKIPKNGVLYAYVIHDLAGRPYITRALFPRVFGRRYMLHWIHRPDNERSPHNHPWDWAKTRILSGGYIEVRGPFTYVRNPGDTATLDATDFHRITDVKPNTWTLFQGGPRDPNRKWGFATPEGFIPFDVYFATAGHEYEGVKS